MKQPDAFCPVILRREAPKNLLLRGGRCFASLSMTALLAACAGPRLTAEDVAIAQYQADAARACYAAQALPAYADARDAALIAMARALSGDPCKATNVYDSRAAIAASQNAAASGIIGSVATAGIATAGIMAGADVLKTAVRGAGSTITGDNNVVTRAEGAASATGPDMSTTTTTTTTTTTHGPGSPPEVRP